MRANCDSQTEAAIDRSTRLRRVLCALALDASRKFGSLEEQMLVLARAFQCQGSIFLPVYMRPLTPDGSAAYDAAGLSVTTLDLLRFRFPTLRKLLALVRTYRIEVVHWHFYHPLNWYVWWLSALAPGVRHYLTDHRSRPFNPVGPARPLVACAKRLLLKRYSRVLAVSAFVLECLRREGIWSHVALCTHFVNTERFQPNPATWSQVRRDLGADDRFVAVVVAHLIPEKGVDVALRAAAAMRGDVVLWVVGDGADRPRLERLSTELQLTQQVRFLGNQRDVAPFIQAADCLLCPSVWREAAGLVNLEALACGVPVVASAVAGIPEFVEHGTTGFLFPVGDHQELAKWLRTLRRDRGLAARLGRNARVAALARFSPEARLPDYLSLYRTPARR
jgi:glycosyltransferase involved in cell wall biosynthesis